LELFLSASNDWAKRWYATCFASCLQASFQIRFKQMEDALHAVKTALQKAAVIAMMKRAKGAPLAEIMKFIGWQAHPVRSFFGL
jgi:hypothetical protein